MKKLLLILLVTSVLGCVDKEVKLPMLSEPGIQDIQNHSQVWMFFAIKNGDTIAKVNRKNTISTTHWIYNIDKRLQLKDFMDEVIRLQDKHRSSIHSKDGMHDYFSYADTLSNTISLIAFDHIVFKKIKTLPLLENEFQTDIGNKNTVKLSFTKNGVLHNKTPILKTEFESFVNKVVSENKEVTGVSFQLSFSSHLTYSDYLYYKTLLNRIVVGDNSLHKTENIVDHIALP